MFLAYFLCENSREHSIHEFSAIELVNLGSIRGPPSLFEALLKVAYGHASAIRRLGLNGGFVRIFPVHARRNEQLCFPDPPFVTCAAKVLEEPILIDAALCTNDFELLNVSIEYSTGNKQKASWFEAIF